jgi:hypothetical protein
MTVTDPPRGNVRRVAQIEASIRRSSTRRHGHTENLCQNRRGRTLETLTF